MRGANLQRARAGGSQGSVPRFRTGRPDVAACGPIPGSLELPAAEPRVWCHFRYSSRVRSGPVRAGRRRIRLFGSKPHIARFRLSSAPSQYPRSWLGFEVLVGVVFCQSTIRGPGWDLPLTKYCACETPPQCTSRRVNLMRPEAPCMVRRRPTDPNGSFSAPLARRHWPGAKICVLANSVTAHVRALPRLAVFDRIRRQPVHDPRVDPDTSASKSESVPHSNLPVTAKHRRPRAGTGCRWTRPPAHDCRGRGAPTHR